MNIDEYDELLTLDDNYFSNNSGKKPTPKQKQRYSELMKLFKKQKRFV